MGATKAVPAVDYLYEVQLRLHGSGSWLRASELSMRRGTTARIHWIFAGMLSATSLCRQGTWRRSAIGDRMPGRVGPRGEGHKCRPPQSRPGVPDAEPFAPGRPSTSGAPISVRNLTQETTCSRAHPAGRVRQQGTKNG